MFHVHLSVYLSQDLRQHRQQLTTNNEYEFARSECKTLSGLFCYGNETSNRYACMNGHLLIDNQSEIREVYLNPVVDKSFKQVINV